MVHGRLVFHDPDFAHTRDEGGDICEGLLGVDAVFAGQAVCNGRLGVSGLDAAPDLGAGRVELDHAVEGFARFSGGDGDGLTGDVAHHESLFNSHVGPPWRTTQKRAPS